jgi:PAS domain S-box-containing protein
MQHTRILVVEDERDVATHIEKCLERFGFEVCGVASTGAEALSFANELHPDLALMDIELSGDMEGVDIAAKMRFDLNVPVIFITGSRDDGTLERAINTEPIGYLLKPFDPATLRTTIESSLHQFRAAKVRAERSLQGAEAQFGAIFENSAFGVCWTSPSGRLLNVNASLADILGYESSAELLARVSDVQKEIYENPKDRQLLIRQLSQEGAVHNFETRARKCDGSLIWISIHAQLIRDADGKDMYYESIIQDIDGQRRIQLERDQMEVMLRQAQKLESIGQLAAGIAHEINTPTQYVGDNVRFFGEAFGSIEKVLRVYAQLYESCKKGRVPDDLLDQVTAEIQAADLEYLKGDIPRAIAQTQEGVDRIATIVRAMKEFSHPGTKEKISSDIHKAIESTLIVCRNEYKYIADLTTDLDPAMPLVPCYPGDFNHVIMNLVVNAAHAIADNLKGSINTKGKILVVTQRDGDWAEIRISDSGTGISEGIRARIFDPFFTTKEVGKGTGQGLAICHAVIVKNHGGTITFDTEVGIGTTFIIRLPLSGGGRESEAA